MFGALGLKVRMRYPLYMGQVSIGSTPSQAQLSVPHSCSDSEPVILDQWTTLFVAKVVERLESRINTFRESPLPGILAASVKEQRSKFDFLEGLICRHKNYEPRQHSLPSGGVDKHPYSVLHRIVKGFLVEFIYQTENRVQPLNIENGRNPTAREYWSARDSEEFRIAKAPGMHHLAASYNQLRDICSNDNRRSVKFHAVGEIVRVCIDTFTEEFPKLNYTFPPHASVYNDHGECILLACQLRAPTWPLVRPLIQFLRPGT
jgi:hypothetical protein